MYEYYFTFGSLTLAQAALRELDRFGIPSRLLRTPQQIRVQGCSHCIVVRSGYYYQTKDLLQTRKLNFRSVFCRLPDGAFEEVQE